MPVYHMVDIDEVAGWVLDGWEHGRYDAILLTSPSVARSALNLLPRNDTMVLAWDEDTAQVLRDAGVDVAAVATAKDDSGVDELAQAVRNRLR